jgi:hypothetical protein
MPLRNCFLTSLAVLTSLLPLIAGSPALASSNEATIYNFQSTTPYPYSGLVAEAAGRMYGVSLSGTYAAGSIYELVPSARGTSWTAKTLFSFDGTIRGICRLGVLRLTAKGTCTE